jgi:hypothetical protein
MKLSSTALLAAGLVALSACGGGAENNVAANAAEEVNLETETLVDDNAVLNEGDLNAGADANAVSNAGENAAENAAENAQ